MSKIKSSKDEIDKILPRALTNNFFGSHMLTYPSDERIDWLHCLTRKET